MSVYLVITLTDLKDIWGLLLFTYFSGGEIEYIQEKTIT